MNRRIFQSLKVPSVVTHPTICFFIFGIILSLPLAALAGYQVGDSVCVQWEEDWGWYEAEILEVSGSQARVHYPGYGTEWDQDWISLSTINPPYSFQVNDAVFIQSASNLALYWLGTVIGVRPGEYQVHYDGRDSSWDEWVAGCRVFPKPKVGDAVYAKYGVDSYVYAHILSMDEHEWKVRYKSWVESRDQIVEWDGEVYFNEVMPCPPGEQAYEEEVLASKAPVPLPVGQSFYFYNPVEEPAAPHSPEDMKPVGLGPAALGGSQLSLAVELPRFDDLMDFYLGLQIGATSDILLFDEDDALRSLADGLRPWRSGAYWPKTTLFKDIPTSILPPDDIYFYLLASPKDQLNDFYLWSTSISPATGSGFFTGREMLSESEIASLIQSVIADMVSKGDAGWYQQVESFIASQKTNSEETAADPLDVFAFAALESNNVYPFCWAAMKKLEEDPSNPWALNTAAVCLFELDNVDAAGRLLDLAYSQDPGLSMTYENAAVYFDRKGDCAQAASLKMMAVEGDLANPYASWDGYQYSLSNGLSSMVSSFDNSIPSNFSLLKSNGSVGSGPPKLSVCCSCNGKFYDDVVLCVDECDVSLTCFTSICTPNLQCCGQKTPFTLSTGLCYPPEGVQVCISADDGNNLDVRLGAGLLGLFGAYIGVKRDFKGNYTVYLSGGTAGGIGKQVILYTTDPKAKVGAMETTVSDLSVDVGVGVSASLSPSSTWKESPICDLNYIGGSQ